VEAIYNYWGYYLPIQRGMPKNCSADLSRIVRHVDRVIDSKNKRELQALQDMFGLGGLEHADDFAS